MSTHWNVSPLLTSAMVPGIPPWKEILPLDGLESSCCAILKEKKHFEPTLDAGACALAEFIVQGKYVYTQTLTLPETEEKVRETNRTSRSLPRLPRAKGSSFWSRRSAQCRAEGLSLRKRVPGEG